MDICSPDDFLPIGLPGTSGWEATDAHETNGVWSRHVRPIGGTFARIAYGTTEAHALLEMIEIIRATPIDRTAPRRAAPKHLRAPAALPLFDFAA